MQTAYQLLVASSPALLAHNKGDLWDTGKVSSDDSIQIEYQGKPLASRQQLWWKVRIWDNKEQLSAWSEPARWTMGLLSAQEWKAKWIGLESGEGKVDEKRTSLRARMLRKEFSTRSEVKSATAYVSGLGWFELYINGKKIGNDVLSPALSDYNKHVFYLTYDVTQDIKRGHNAVGAMLGNGLFFAPRTRFAFGYPRLLMQLEIEYKDGKRETVVTDRTWKLTDQGPIGNNNEYDGEEYDARGEIKGWNMPSFDDSTWKNATEVTAPAGQLIAQPIEPIRIRETLKPIKKTIAGPNRYIFDMGQNMVGWVRLSASGPSGSQIKIRHAETLSSDGSLYVENLRTARATDLYTMKGIGTETYEPRFTYHGFRYVEVTTVPGVSEPVIEGQVVYDSIDQTASFESSSPLLNQIHQNIVWGTKGNYHSIPTDCPQRDERMGWLGDRLASSRGEMYLFDNAALYSKWIDDMADSQREDGALSDVAPAYWKLYRPNVTWPASFIAIPQHLYELQGDRRVIERNYPAMKKWMTYMSTFLEDGIMPKDIYGDWCVPPESPKLIHSEDPLRRTEGDVLGTAYFYYLSRLMADDAHLLGKTQEAAEFRETAERVKLAFNKKFFHPESNTYSNGTQTSSILPLAFGIVPEDRRKAVFEAMLKKMAEQNKGHVGTGLIGAQWLMRTLTDNGRPEMAYEIASQTTYPSWGYMISKGATTIWELWNGDTANPKMNSGNHLMLVGDLNVWFYERLAGIRPDPAKPGFKHIILKPYPVSGLSYVKAAHSSPYGKITSSWQKEQNRLKWSITTPPNTTALVYIPAQSADSVLEGQGPASTRQGIKFLRMEEGAAVYEVGSGVYVFSSELPKY